MTLRRLVASLVVALWSLPAASATGVLLHVALEHTPAGETSFAWSSARVDEHGWARLAAAAEHEHDVTLESDPPLRRGDAPCVVPPARAAAGVASGAPLRNCGAAPSMAPPPRARGPALLALLAVLRV